MFKTTLIKYIKYLLILRDEVKKDKINGNKYKNIKKSRNKIVKILANLKS